MTRTQPYDPVKQQFPPRFANEGEEVFFIVPHLRPHYHRTPELDAERIARWRETHDGKPFVLNPKLWPPAGFPPEIRPDRRAELAHALALAAADGEREKTLAAEREQARDIFRTCQCCGAVDPSTAPRKPLPDLAVDLNGKQRVCEKCVQVLRHGYRARLAAGTKQAAREQTPNGRRGDACERWLTAWITAAGE